MTRLRQAVRHRLLRRLMGVHADQPPAYNADNLCVWRKNVDFLHEPRFVEAYRQGMFSGHKIGGVRGVDLHIEWRVHIICWAASHAVHLPGDLVECGVNTGMNSLAACHYIDLNATGKRFFLFDTFEGIPAEQMTAAEKVLDRQEGNLLRYEECYEVAKSNFAPYPNAHLVRGRIPETLSSVQIDRVCYLSVDMNITLPEVAAMEHFWDRLVPGAVVVLDDYGWEPHLPQKVAMDHFAEARGVSILTLPTGQGLILKPAP